MFRFAERLIENGERAPDHLLIDLRMAALEDHELLTPVTQTIAAVLLGILSARIASPGLN